MKPGELPEVQPSAANGVEFVDVQFVKVVVHVSLLLCLGRDHPLTRGGRGNSGNRSFAA